MAVSDLAEGETCLGKLQFSPAEGQAGKVRDENRWGTLAHNDVDDAVYLDPGAWQGVLGDDVTGRGAQIVPGSLNPKPQLVPARELQSRTKLHSLQGWNGHLSALCKEGERNPRGENRNYHHARGENEDPYGKSGTAHRGFIPFKYPVPSIQEPGEIEFITDS